MPVFYEDQAFIVKQGWFGPWRVVNKMTGATIAPDLVLQEKLGFAWPKIRHGTRLPKADRRFAEDVLMQTFAMAAVNPAGELGQLFASASPDQIADSVTAEAIARLALIR